MSDIDVDELRSCYKYAIDNRDSKDAVERGRRFDRWLATIQPSPDDPAMVERVARVLYAQEYEDPDSVTEEEWTSINAAESEFYLSTAHAVLAAIAGGDHA